ncbi:hypothetical protein AB0M20_24210 [Actinoplanes sp. NPDC051633]|uniref:hypothetical protein n=1 Tax=Actinoplanes sp. NPDC051633 TaxID=3155670 RepID=UPI0034296254
MNVYAPPGPSAWTGVIISACALLFTVVSFWWLQARRGRLRSFPPQTYAGVFTTERVQFNFPVVLHNTGPAPIVVLAFRLRIDKTVEQYAATQAAEHDEKAVLPVHMSWQATQSHLHQAGVRGEQTLPAPFPVEGRSAVERFIELGMADPPLLFENGPYTADIEVKLADRRSWRPLVSFPLHTELTQADGRDRYRTWTNDPGWRP